MESPRTVQNAGRQDREGRQDGEVARNFATGRGTWDKALARAGRLSRNAFFTGSAIRDGCSLGF